PDQRPLVHLADLPLDSEQLLLPRRLGALRELAVQIVGRGPFLTGELEDADALEAHLGNEIAQFFELCLCLAREADDEAGPERQVRDALADPAHQLAYPGRVPAAL